MALARTLSLVGPTLRATARSPGRAALVVLEVAVALAVVTVSFELAADSMRSVVIDTGIDEQSMVGVTVTPYGPERRAAVAPERVAGDLALVRGTPGVRDAALSSWMPYTRYVEGHSVRAPNGQAMDVGWLRLGERGPETLGLQLTEGRMFAPDPDAREVVVTRSLADRFYPGGALGQRHVRPSGGGEDVVVGVVADVMVLPAYFPHVNLLGIGAGTPTPDGPVHFLVRVDGDPAAVSATLAAGLGARDSRRLVVARPLPEIFDQTKSVSHIMAFLLLLVLGLALIASALGVGGTMSLAVTRRTRQIGAARALGASRGDIVTHVMIETGLLTCAGVLVGVPLALGVDALIRSGQTERPLPPLDSSILLVSAAVLVVIGLLSALAPALRAARLEPVVATRSL